MREHPRITALLRVVLNGEEPQDLDEALLEAAARATARRARRGAGPDVEAILARGAGDEASKQRSEPELKRVRRGVRRDGRADRADQRRGRRRRLRERSAGPRARAVRGVERGDPLGAVGVRSVRRARADATAAFGPVGAADWKRLRELAGSVGAWRRQQAGPTRARAVSPAAAARATLDVEAGAEDSDSDPDDDPPRGRTARGAERAPRDSGGGGSEVGGGWLYTKCVELVQDRGGDDGLPAVEIACGVLDVVRRAGGDDGAVQAGLFELAMG